MLGKIQFQNSPGTLDFNKIIPMPESLEMNSGSITNEAIVSYMRAVNPETPAFDDVEKLLIDKETRGREIRWKKPKETGNDREKWRNRAVYKCKGMQVNRKSAGSGCQSLSALFCC